MRRLVLIVDVRVDDDAEIGANDVGDALQVGLDRALVPARVTAFTARWVDYSDDE